MIDTLHAESVTEFSAAARFVERRQSPRYVLTKPVYAVAIRPNCAPDEAREVLGFTWDAGEDGLRFEVPGVSRLPTSRLLVGIESQDGSYHFATVEMRHMQPTSLGISLGVQFVGEARELLREANLMPTFEPKSFRFGTGLPREVLDAWAELGVLRPMLVDRVLVCPQCRGVPTLRDGCRACGSIRMDGRQLIHHFACAHVGFVEDFETPDGVRCPKCRTTPLVVGADFEYVRGPYRCADCDWTDYDLERVGQCLRCGLRFPFQQAVEEELIGYHVQRLDPLALLEGA